MPKYKSSQHHLIEAVKWDPAQPAERVNDFIITSQGTSRGYLISSDKGDVVINTGTPYQGDRYRERYEQLLGRSLDVKKILLTQNHFDHIGGWSAFAGPECETIVQRNFPVLVQERAMLASFFQPRGQRVLHSLLPSPEVASVALRHPKELEISTTFADDYRFEVGGRRFELYSAPSGETFDSMFVWLPDEKILFTGNWMGALYGALPHFYTLRGDRDRSVPQFIRDVERIIGLEPKMLLTGHDEPIVGQGRIASDMTKLRDAVRYIHDETVKGMNEGKDMYALMREIKLPAKFDMAPGRGPVTWYVRAVWEEYTGWFHQNLTSELYAEPAQTIWSELAEMVGGLDKLATQARRHLDVQEPVKALHFIEIALSIDSGHRASREAEIDALEQLIEATGGATYDELGWLETKWEEANEVLNDS